MTCQRTEKRPKIMWGPPFLETTCASVSVPGTVADTHNQYRMITKPYKRISRPTRVLNIRCAASTADQPNKQLQRNWKAQPTCHRQLGCGRDLNLLSFSFILASPSLQTLSDYTTEAARLSTEGTQQVLTLLKEVGKYAVWESSKDRGHKA